MMSGRCRAPGIAGATSLATLLLPVLAAAATLRTTDGSFVRVEPTVLPALRFGGERELEGGGGLRYEFVDASGHVDRGAVPGTVELRGSRDPSLAQDPLTGGIFLVFAARSRGEEHLAFSAWTGRGFTEPQRLFSQSWQDHQPLLAFRPSGEAVLAWRSGPDGRVLLRHFEMGPFGETRLISFIDVGRPSAYLSRAGGDVSLRGGLAHLACEAPDDVAYVVLAEPASGGVAILRVDGASVRNGSGIGASPVPVTLARAPEGRSTGSGAPHGGSAVVGAVLEPFRVDVQRAEVYFWLENDSVRAIAFRDGDPGRLLVLPRPASDDLALRAVVHAVRRELRVGSVRLARGERARSEPGAEP